MAIAAAAAARSGGHPLWHFALPLVTSVGVFFGMKVRERCHRPTSGRDGDQVVAD